MAKALTDIAIRKEPFPATGRTELWDTNVRGLHIRISPKGARAWFIRYRSPAGHRRYKIGNYPGLSLTDARKEARALLTSIDRGSDPQREKLVARKTDAPPSVKEATVRYVDSIKGRNRSWRETERIFKTHVLPRWGKRQIDDVTRADIIEALDEIAVSAPYMANATMRQMRRFFNWCVEKDILQSTPMAGVKLPHRETSRDRVLTDEELAELWAVWDTMPYPFGPFFKLAALTAQRREEVATMRWEHINLAEKIWSLPREFTKSDRAHDVPLSERAVAVLESLPRQSSGLVFSTNNKTSVSGFSKAKRKCDEQIKSQRAKTEGSPMQPWRIHDLRRTAASGMARLGTAPHVVEKVLNHTSGEISGVGAVYNRYGFDSEKRTALDAWSVHVSEATGAAPAAANG